MIVDLHSHTNASDGVLDPEELVKLAAGRGIRYLAITDHDCTYSLPRALAKAREYPSLTLIPGVELSTDVPTGEIHILGYCMDYDDPEFQATISEFRESRKLRARKMVEKLCDMGLNLEWEMVQRYAGDGSMGRPHVAQALMEKGYVSSVQEAFAKYIGRDGPAYVKRRNLTPVQAVELIASINGQPVLAHPGDVANIDTVLRELKEVGLVGMEVYYDHYSQETVQRLARIAERHDLIPCGGSDYHGEGLGARTELGEVDVPVESAQRLLAMAEKRAGKTAQT